jgi:hypothetical protein
MEPTPADHVQIHQALHGYVGGHRLLAASRQVPAEAERALLMLSDVSGPASGHGFSSYLTGYPLPGAGAYALARTWPAPKMDRPGCVWTHTLLIADADLARLPDVGALLALFRRPGRDDARDSYQRPAMLRVPQPGEGAEAAAGWTEGEASRALTVLYGVTDAPAFLVSDDPDRTEDLVLAVWAQQWPGLRRAFRFCTWSLACRSADGRPFDLQVVPPGVRGQLARQAVTGAIADLRARPGAGPSPPPTPAWVTAATTDLRDGPGGALRRFLWAFGPDLAATRDGFAGLLEIGHQLELVRNGRASAVDLVEVACARLPRPQDGARLKVALFGERAADGGALGPSAREVDVLRALATARASAALTADALAIRQRGGALWRHHREEAVQLGLEIARRTPRTPLAEHLLDGVAASVAPSEANALRDRDPRLFAELARWNPSLAASREPPGALPVPSRKTLRAVPSRGTAGAETTMVRRMLQRVRRKSASDPRGSS